MLTDISKHLLRLKPNRTTVSHQLAWHQDENVFGNSASARYHQKSAREHSYSNVIHVQILTQMQVVTFTNWRSPRKMQELNRFPWGKKIIFVSTIVIVHFVGLSFILVVSILRFCGIGLAVGAFSRWRPPWRPRRWCCRIRAFFFTASVWQILLGRFSFTRFVLGRLSSRECCFCGVRAFFLRRTETLTGIN